MTSHCRLCPADGGMPRDLDLRKLQAFGSDILDIQAQAPERVYVALGDGKIMVLDRLLVKAYPLAHRHRHTAPPVLYLTRPADHTLFESLKRDVRVRGSLSFPPRLDQLLAATASLLPERSQPASSGLLPPVMPFSPPS